MLRSTYALVSGLCLALIPLTAMAEENYGAILQALPDEVPNTNSPACLPDAADAALASNPSVLGGYLRPFDDKAATEVLAYLERAIAAAPASSVAPPGPADFPGQTPVQAFAQSYGSLGLNPEDALDVAALYLVVAWAAQKGDISVIGSLDADQLAAVKAQLVGSALRCAILLGITDDLAQQRNQMIALTGLLIDGMESHSRSGTLDSLAAEARKLFGDQTDGLVLTARGFSKP